MNHNFEKRYRAIGANIMYYRRLRGYTQLQLAEKAGISRTHISNIEAPNCKTSISLDLLLTIAEVLEVPVNDLLSFPSISF